MLCLLMLMVLLYGVNSTCTDEALTLDPSEVIEEFGKVVSANCTTSLEDHGGMYWSNGTRTTDIEEEGFFISQTVNLSDWNVMAECKILLNNSFECSKKLEITVYRNPDKVDLYPLRHVPAVLEGTEYVLQCDIIDVAPVQNLIVRWYKNKEMIHIHKFNSTTKAPVMESSILRVNISREKSGTQFTCEAQLDFGPNGPKTPVVSGTHSISVHFAPELSSNATEDIYVQEGNDVTVNCEAESHPPPHFHWTRDGVNMTENTNSLNITQVNSDTVYTCTATNKHGRIIKHIHVHVIRNTMATPNATMATSAASAQEACPITLTPAEIVVRFGDPASVICNTSATDVIGMGWEAAYGGTGFVEPPSVTWKVEKLEAWNEMPKCYITLDSNKQCSVTPVITLYRSPDNVSLSALHDGPMVEGKEYLLICNITNVAPVQNLTVKWFRDSETVTTQVFRSTNPTLDTVGSTLNVTAKREYNGALFTCRAELHLGPHGPQPVPTTTSEPYTPVVHYKPLMQCETHYTYVEHQITMEKMPCKIQGDPPPTIHWYYQEKLINVSEPLTRNHSGIYTAEVVNSLNRTKTSVNITIEYGPSFTCNDRYEVKENGKVHVLCEPEGIPTPIITWFKDGKEISPQRWTKHDSGNYLLRATNTHGKASHMLYLNVMFAPEFKEGNYSKEVTLGENVTFDCSAEGNPAPEIVWNYTTAVNARENTGGRHKTISVTGATSTNAGVYICVATNKVGRVSRSVTLMMKGATAGLPFTVLLMLLILCAVLSILILILIIHNKRKKHGQYSFISGQAKESDIPLTTKSEGGKA